VWRHIYRCDTTAQRRVQKEGPRGKVFSVVNAKGGSGATTVAVNLSLALQAAHGEVEDEEDEHLYHTTGWTRELWIESLGLPAVLPPPEEVKDVKTAIGASRAEQARAQML